MRRMRHLLPAAGLALLAAGCSSDDILSVDPTTVVPAAGAITDVVSARAAVAGLHDALQDGSYYGESFVSFVELSSDNALHSGTFSTYATADNFQNSAENTTIGGIWSDIYQSIARANSLIAALTEPSFVISEDEQNQALAEAYFIRALGYHNLVKLWGNAASPTGGVPLITEPVTDAQEAGNVTRASVADVYAQIFADLDQAEALVNEEPSWTLVTAGAVHAIRARAYFYQASTLTGAAQQTAYRNAIAEADAVTALGYTLAGNYADLFDEAGNSTPEDIFRVRFNDQDAGSVSYYYMAKGLGGRREVSSTSGIRNLYASNDLRRAWNLGLSGTTNYIAKFRSVVGTEHIHVIRYAEVLLIKAESHARLNELPQATAALNLVRARAGLAPRLLGTVGYTTQQEVTNAIITERRLELAFEGDRWPDLIRLGLSDDLANATCNAVLQSPCPEQAIYPIPQTELDVWNQPDQQNPGY